MALNGAEALISGAYLVDLFPILRYVPHWVPGATFKKRANDLKKCVKDSLELPFQEARRRMESGNQISSMSTRWFSKIGEIQDKRERDRTVQAVQDATGSVLLAGSETTISTLMIFVFLMVLYPASQTEARAELDRVIGRDRLPDFSDKDNLPYVNAIIKEVMRLFPALPLGLPHVVIAEDEFKGMRIPKGSVVFPNVWSMARDKKVYGPDADEFRPERFLEADLRDPKEFVFGFGRRICPGRYMSDNSIFIAFASILHACTISKAVDKNGMTIPVEARWAPSITVHLEPFVCSIKPRFEHIESLVGTSDM